MEKRSLATGLIAIVMALGLAITSYAGYTYDGYYYEATVHPDWAVGGVYTAQTDEMTTSSFTILKNADGSYHLFVYAVSSHHPYVESFSGTGYLWNSTNIGETILLFISDEYLWGGSADRVYVAFNDNVDFPSLFGMEESESDIKYITYLYDCNYYTYERMCPENNLEVANCNESITLRTGDSTAAAEICQIPLHSTMKYLGIAGNGFFKVSYNGQEGYVLAKYTVPKFQ